MRRRGSICYEVASLVAHASTDKRRIGGMKQGDIGVGNRLVCFVDDSACEVAVGLVDALHVDLMLFLAYDTDRIEAHHLQDGISD